MIDRVFFELSDQREPKFEKWVFSQVGLHLPTLLEEKQKTWAVTEPLETKRAFPEDSSTG